MSTELGLRIKRIREYRNYTQTHLAEKLDISQNAYSKIENGTSKITTERLEEIAKVLDVPAETIINTERQIFNVDNNHIEKFYIEHLYDENKDLMEKSHLNFGATIPIFETTK